MNAKRKIALILVAVLVLWVLHKYWFELRGVLGVDKYDDFEKGKDVKDFQKTKYLRWTKGKQVKAFKKAYNDYIAYIRKKGIKCSCKKINCTNYFTPRDEKNVQKLADDLTKNKANFGKIKKLDPFTGLGVTVALMSINAELYNEKGEKIRDKDPNGPFAALETAKESIFDVFKKYDIVP